MNLPPRPEPRTERINLGHGEYYRRTLGYSFDQLRARELEIIEACK